MRITVLGSGTSHGVPMPLCKCKVCTSRNPKNKRTRASILIEYNGRTVLVDTATDFRQQALVNNIRRLDAILFTHAHADHIHGLDDIRLYCHHRGRAIPAYAGPATARIIRRSFAYVFRGVNEGGGIPDIDLRVINAKFPLYRRTVIPVPLWHGKRKILGFRIGRFAYTTDCSGIPKKSMELLRGLDVLIITGLRPTPHRTHFSVGQALEIIEELKPKRAYLTHITHLLDHDKTNAELPRHVKLAHDGLVIESR
ncbi:MAG: MBL fold metallo-hydrolase [Planctomycetota bacterium]